LLNTYKKFSLQSEADLKKEFQFGQGAEIILVGGNNKGALNPSTLNIELNEKIL
jgi:hypothetical protein